jgi:membrane-associated phospholipid phosphatase
MEPDRTRRDGDLLRHPSASAWLSLAMLALAVAVTVLVAVDVTAPPIIFRVDVWWRQVVQPPTTWAHDLSETLYLLGSGWVMVPLRIGVAVWLGLRRRWVDLAAWLGAWAAADVLTQALKHGVGRMRPDLANAASFPSGHVKTAAQVSVGLVLLTIPPWRSRRWGWIAATTWITTMSLSRTILDEHWASDTIAGALIGTGLMLLVAVAAQRVRDARTPAPSS